MKIKKDSAGFTIIELMVGMVASSIVALAAGSILYFTWIGWRDAGESVALQRDALVAVRTLEHIIRNASLAQIGGWASDNITFTADTDYDSGDMAADSAVTLQSFSVVSNDYGGVVISLELETSRREESKTYNLTIYPRN